jgi:precorrin-6Y C5,15-methyltransferase (decarboxylating)
MARLRDAGYIVDAVQVQASRVRPLPDGGLRMAAINPVFLVSGTRNDSAGNPS